MGKHGQPICPGIRSNCKGSWSPSPHRCDIGLQVKPKRGNVILWYNIHADGRGDQNALHGGCPPAAGFTKWSGNKWINSKSLRLPHAQWMPDHPAMKRFGWRENNKPNSNSNECQLEVVNMNPADVELFWVNPGNKELVKMGDIQPDGSSNHNSYKGHEFIGKSKGGVQTKPFRCAGPLSKYFIDENLVANTEKQFKA